MLCLAAWLLCVAPVTLCTCLDEACAISAPFSDDSPPLPLQRGYLLRAQSIETHPRSAVIAEKPLPNSCPQAKHLP